MSSEKPASARERILDVAGPLFWREGYRAVGVDRVIAEAGVAKASFYYHFPSKDDLIVAWIERAEAMAASVAPPMDGPTPLSDYARAMIAIAQSDACFGCTYQGTAAEFADPAHPAHAASIGVKLRVIDDLTDRARRQGLRAPETIAEQVFLLIEGVWAATRMFGPERAPLAHATEAVEALIEASGRSG